jgi:hypothetical protein|tara:strand:- start:453 stop:644 length:192 start_codon:yes stop_codon:yes gene_type:complete
MASIERVNVEVKKTKFYCRTIDKDGYPTDELCSDYQDAKTKATSAGGQVHICKHDEGEACTLE